MESDILGYIGIALIILGAAVWIFRPTESGETEFEFLGFRARLNVPGIAVMAFGLVLIVVSYKKTEPCPVPTPTPTPSANCADIEGDYKSTKQQTFHITQTGCHFSTVVKDISINVENFVDGEVSATFAAYTVRRVDHNRNDCEIILGGFLDNITRLGYTSHVFNLSGNDQSSRCNFPFVKDNINSNTDQFRWSEVQHTDRITPK